MKKNRKKSSGNLSRRLRKRKSSVYEDEGKSEGEPSDLDDPSGTWEIKATAAASAVPMKEEEPPRKRPFRAVRNKSLSYAELSEYDVEAVGMNERRISDFESELGSLKWEELNRIVLTRGHVERYIPLINFQTTMPGFFVRIPMQDGSYRACRVEEVFEGDRSYRVGSTITKFGFMVRYGALRQRLKLNSLSSKKLTHKDFQSWIVQIRRDFSGTKKNKFEMENFVPSKEVIEMKERDMIQLSRDASVLKEFVGENFFKPEPKLKQLYLQKLDLSERQPMLDCTNTICNATKIHTDGQVKPVESNDQIVKEESYDISNLASAAGLVDGGDLDLRRKGSILGNAVEMMEKHIEFGEGTEGNNVTSKDVVVGNKQDTPRFPNDDGFSLMQWVEVSGNGKNIDVKSGQELVLPSDCILGLNYNIEYMPPKIDVSEEPSTHASEYLDSMPGGAEIADKEKDALEQHRSIEKSCPVAVTNNNQEFVDQDDIMESAPCVSSVHGNLTYSILDDPAEILFRLLEKQDEVIRYLKKQRKNETDDDF